jgi:hypothetical protein
MYEPFSAKLRVPAFRAHPKEPIYKRRGIMDVPVYAHFVIGEGHLTFVGIEGKPRSTAL